MSSLVGWNEKFLGVFSVQSILKILLKLHAKIRKCCRLPNMLSYGFLKVFVKPSVDQDNHCSLSCSILQILTICPKRPILRNEIYLSFVEIGSNFSHFRKIRKRHFRFTSSFFFFIKDHDFCDAPASSTVYYRLVCVSVVCVHHNLRKPFAPFSVWKVSGKIFILCHFIFLLVQDRWHHGMGDTITHSWASFLSAGYRDRAMVQNIHQVHQKREF